jgi:hypothetical protein
MGRSLGEGGENGISFTLSPNISKYENRNEKEDYFDNLLTGNRTESSRYHATDYRARNRDLIPGCGSESSVY